jgi:AcrR family transcriptional regulator
MEPVGVRRPGGRSARVRAAVLTATLEEIAARGGRFSVEAVASRAGVHKTTVYRRWPTRGALLLDALLDRSSVEVPMPDTGSVEGDLRTLMHAIVANLQSQLASGVVRALVDEPDDEELRAAALAFWRERFSLVAGVITRGVERGELTRDSDPDLLIELLIGPLYLRLLVTLEPLTEAYADRVVEMVLRACRR